MSSCKENKGENMCIIDEIALGKIIDLVCKKIGEAISNAKWEEFKDNYRDTTIKHK